MEVVANCLDQAFTTVDNGGLDSTGEVPHVILTVGESGTAVAEVNVFSSALTALAGYRAIRSFEAGLVTKLASSSVIVYMKQLPAGMQRQIQVCG